MLLSPLGGKQLHVVGRLVSEACSRLPVTMGAHLTLFPFFQVTAGLPLPKAYTEEVTTIILFACPKRNPKSACSNLAVENKGHRP